MDALAKIVVGLGYGDEGKGTTIDWLARHHNAKTVVRFNGGAQAAHHVVLPDGRHHCFAQFGSGTFAGARTHLSRFMLVNPIFAIAEATALERVRISNPLSLMTVEDDALVTTQFHVAMNRLRELARGDGRHGSCGMGIGETVADSLTGDEVIRVRDLRDPAKLRKKLACLQALKRAELIKISSRPEIETLGPQARFELAILEDPTFRETILEYFLYFAERVQIVDRDWLPRKLEEPGVTLFEGAQGVLLDENYGFHPHTTWTDCTFGNAFRLLVDVDIRAEKLGVTRAFHTRHGEGPFVTETADLQIKGDHNVSGPWQGDFRVGHLDLVALRYALDVACVGDLVLTWVDALGAETKICTHYETGSKTLRGEKQIETWEPKIERLSMTYLSEERTRALSHVRPVYQTLPSAQLPSFLEEQLSVKIVMTSHGPTHRDKLLRGEVR